MAANQSGQVTIVMDIRHIFWFIFLNNLFETTKNSPTQFEKFRRLDFLNFQKQAGQ